VSLAFQTEVAAAPDNADAKVVVVTGRVTYQDAPELRKSLLGEISATSTSALVVELGGIEQMDTSGAAVLVEALMLGRKRGLRLLLCSPSESVLRMFRLAGLEEVLGQCCSDPAETKRRLQE